MLSKLGALRYYFLGGAKFYRFLSMPLVLIALYIFYPSCFPFGKDPIFGCFSFFLHAARSAEEEQPRERLLSQSAVLSVC